MHLAHVLALALLAGALAGCASPQTTPAPPPTPSPANGPASPPATPAPTPSPATPAPAPAPAPAPSPPAQSQAGVALNGAGSTFVYPLMSKWSSEYNKLTGAQVNYQSIGSGGGITQVTNKVVDFAASDAPLNPTQRAAAPGLVHVPESLGAVAIIYNLPGVGPLRLTGAVLADIYLGNVKTWNDPEIAALNPGASLPSNAVFTVHRSDGSGTTYAFTDYLSKVSGTWKSTVGKGTAPSWPSAAQQVGAKGSEAVSGVVSQNPYSIGYVEMSYAAENQLATASVQNAAGEWAAPSLAGVSAAAASVADALPAGGADWGDVSITNANGTGVYPISTFTYILLYKDLSGAYGSKMTQDRAQALVQFAWWAVHDGQQFGPNLQYPALPDPVVKLDEATLRSVTYDGQPLVS